MGKALRGKRAFSNWYVKTYYSLKILYSLLPAEPGKWKRENGTGGVIPENKAKEKPESNFAFF